MQCLGVVLPPCTSPHGPHMQGFFSFLPSIQLLIIHPYTQAPLNISALCRRPSLFLRCHLPAMYTPAWPLCADGLPACSILLATSHRFGSTSRARWRQSSREHELPSLWHPRARIAGCWSSRKHAPMFRSTTGISSVGARREGVVGIWFVFFPADLLSPHFLSDQQRRSH